jgi:hypothetical protein
MGFLTIKKYFLLYYFKLIGVMKVGFEKLWEHVKKLLDGFGLEYDINFS